MPSSSSAAAPSVVSLALSGGGVRAMAVHMGVIRFLAEQGWLERVARVSTVSGGSLVIGLVVARAGRTWPTSDAFIKTVYGAVRESMCSRSLIWDTLAQLRNPLNWQFLLSRANLLGKALGDNWSLDFPLREVPPVPEWSINATSAENGKRFRFKGSTIGDYETGYAEAEDFSLATALAVSAAFPGGIGPLALNSSQFEWKRRGWGEPAHSAKPVAPEFATLHLYDGGVYDNLGLEPLFDAGRSASKAKGDIIIVSDAGAPLGEGFSSGVLSPWRLKRVADIMSDQSRNLRVRSFVEFIKRARAGAFIQVDNPLFDRKLNAAADFTCKFPTTLRQLTESEFDIMAGHGYAVMRRVQEVYGTGIV